MARRLDPTIALQQLLSKQLLGALQSDVLTEVRQALQGRTIEFCQRAQMAATGLKITPQTMPSLYNLFMEVKQELEYPEDVDFYIKGSSQVNASAYISETPELPHIIIINSALFNLMDEQELKYILGHEFGHLFNKDSYLNRLYSFVYPDDNAPEILKTRMLQYDQLAEYAADRYGYQACMDLGACVSASYKLTCGIDLKKMNVSIDSLIEQNHEKKDNLIRNRVLNLSDHPDIPLRIHALELYANCKTLKALEEGMNELFRNIPGLTISELDEQMAIFMGAAGILMASEDGKIDRYETDLIIEEMGKYILEPSYLFKKIKKHPDLPTLLEQTVSFIIDKDEDKAEEMIQFFIKVAFADKAMSKEELDAIKDFGHKVNLDDDDIYHWIAEYVHNDNFYSLADSL